MKLKAVTTSQQVGNTCIKCSALFSKKLKHSTIYFMTDLDLFLLQEELNPLQNATHSIASKNKELLLIITTFETYPEENINPLSMVLNGVIDANVNGGISKYQQVNQFLLSSCISL